MDHCGIPNPGRAMVRVKHHGKLRAHPLSVRQLARPQAYVRSPRASTRAWSCCTIFIWLTCWTGWTPIYAGLLHESALRLAWILRARERPIERREASVAAYPCSSDVLRNSVGVIVHSDHAIELARKWYGDGVSAL